MNEVIVYTDGASRGNPGPASIGVWIETLGKSYAECIGVTTNNDAEYQALVFALKKIKALLGKTEAKVSKISCRLDSELVVKQLNHQYKVEHPITQKHFFAVWNLMLDFGEVSFTHVPRELNKKADALTNEALDKEGAQKRIF